LQSSLNSIEDNIQNARRYYNAVVRDFNTRVQSFPTNIIAGMFGFHARQFFEMRASPRDGWSDNTWQLNQCQQVSHRSFP